MALPTEGLEVHFSRPVSVDALCCSVDARRVNRGARYGHTWIAIPIKYCIALLQSLLTSLVADISRDPPGRWDSRCAVRSFLFPLIFTKGKEEVGSVPLCSLCTPTSVTYPPPLFSFSQVLIISSSVKLSPSFLSHLVPLCHSLSPPAHSPLKKIELLFEN